MADRRSTGLVYSTELGRTCPDCREALGRCRCHASQAVVGDGNVRVSRETKGRGGKCVTVIAGLPLGTNDLGTLAAALKKRCGTGGTAKDGLITIQGDHRDMLVTHLQSLGYRAKPSGG
ncbi:MAG TPA: translation initiation factor Sui1 [Gemmatimonadales bacterium]